jgi:hypothetical protein
MKIVKSTESIAVDHPVIGIYGQPGIGKSSLGYSAKDPLTLDFDNGAHRAVNRKDTWIIERWSDVGELDADALAPYSTIIVDTVGRLLDLLSADIIESNPKMGRDGSLTLQGFGTLKSRFRQWMTQLRLMGKDVVLIAHAREEKDNDLTIMRPDVQGGSYGEVMKTADLVGFLYMRGKDRVLDFNPTDRWHGKNPGGWKPTVLPPVEKAQHVLAKMQDDAREALGNISAESAKVMQSVEDWKAAIAGYTTLEEVNRAIPEVKKMPTIVQAQVKTLLHGKAIGLGFVSDKKTGGYVAPIPEPVGS